MARNVEIKARIESIESLLPKVIAIADSGPTEIRQDDTFVSCPSGRLKLRSFSESDGQLIYYERSNVSGPKESFYIISPTESVATLREALSLAYGQRGRVRKHRTLFLLGRTRIHLELESERTRAIVSRDLAAVERLHAPEYELITPPGRVWSRARYIAAIAAEPFYASWECGPIRCVARLQWP